MASESHSPLSSDPDSKTTISSVKYCLGMQLRSIDSQNDLDTSTMSNGELIKELLKLRLEHHEFKQEVMFQKDLLRSVGQAIICTDLSGNITYWNRAAEQIYGWSEQEAVGQSIMAITPADTSVNQAAEIFAALSKGEVWSGEFLVRKRDSTSFHAMVTDTPIMDENHNLVGVIGVSADISEMKKKEQEIRALNARLEKRVMERTEELEKANKALKEEIQEHLNAKKHLQKCVESLEESRDKITEQSKKLSVLVDELKEARIEAESASRLKSRFLASMSHEIRTPMNGVLGMTNLILSTQLSEEQKQFVETIQNCGDSLLTIINDILDFSKIEAGELVLENISFDILQCMEESVDLLAVKAVEKNIELVNYVNETVPRIVNGDPGRLRQVIVNLLSNATKFTSRGEITVNMSSILVKEGNASEEMEEEIEGEGEGEGERYDVHEIHVSVKDTGIGIAKDRMDRLFKPFSQLDETMTRKFGGTGLGLIISRQLVELMGGRVWVESEGENKGSTFHFTVLMQSKNGETLKKEKSIQNNRKVSRSFNARSNQIVRKLRRFESIVLEESEKKNEFDDSLKQKIGESTINSYSAFDKNVSINVNGDNNVDNDEKRYSNFDDDDDDDDLNYLPSKIRNKRNGLKSHHCKESRQVRLVRNGGEGEMVMDGDEYCTNNISKLGLKQLEKESNYVSESSPSSLPTCNKESKRKYDFDKLSPSQDNSVFTSFHRNPSSIPSPFSSSSSLQKNPVISSPHNPSLFPSYLNEETSCRGKSVLLIDRFPNSQEMLKKFLSSLSMNVIVAENAEVAQNILRNEHHLKKIMIDVVIADTRLNWIPYPNGHSKENELEKKDDGIREYDMVNNHHLLPTLLLFPYGTANKEQYLNRNVVAVLSKPIRQTQLMNVLIEVFRKDAKMNIAQRTRDTLMKDAGFRADMAVRHPLNILLAEDNIVNQKVACKTLSRLGYKCDIVCNGLEAVKAAETQKYDLILMDLQMPKMDGIEATKLIIQKFGQVQRPKIFALTANVLESHRSLCIDVGMDGFISKPINVREIIKAIEQCHSG